VEWILLLKAGHEIGTEGEAKISAQPSDLSELLITQQGGIIFRDGFACFPPDNNKRQKSQEQSPGWHQPARAL
jgi:hypothetical protein